MNCTLFSFFRTVFFSAGVLLIGALHIELRAQAPVEPVAAICFMSWERPVSGLFTTIDGKKFTEINCPAYRFGRASQIKAGATLPLYRQVERDGVKVYEIAQELALPADCVDFQAYVVRQPDKEGAPAYRLVVMANDSSVFPAGDVRVFNFSPFPAMVRLGDDSYPLAPLEWKQLKSKPDRKYRVILMTALQVGGNWIEGGRELMSLRPEYRGDVIVVHTKAELGTPTQDQLDARALTIATTYYVPGWIPPAAAATTAR
jgi:hypothetical protein